MISIPRFHTIVASLVLFSAAVIPSGAFAAKYCTDLISFPGDNGEMSFEVETNDVSRTASVTIVAGMGKGWKFTGDWHPDGKGNGIAEVSMDKDPVVGYLAFDIFVKPGVSIVGYSADGIPGHLPKGAAVTLRGRAGACKKVGSPLIGNYCLRVGAENKLLEVVSESSGFVRGKLEVRPGVTSTFLGRRDSTGLVLKISISGTAYVLEFGGNLISGRYRRSGRSYSIYGIRNPMTGVVGCDGIRLYSHGSANFYYSTPTIVGQYAYVGTASGTNHRVARDNFFAKINLSTMTEVWRYNLGSREVRGSAVLDSKGAIYFVTETGRTQQLVSGAEASGDHSKSRLKLMKLSNPDAKTPKVVWQRLIVGKRAVYDLGQITPAISKSDVVVVGGRLVQAYRSNGKLLWKFSPKSGTQEFYNSPLVNSKTVFVNSDGGSSDSSPAKPNGIYAIDIWSGSERWSYVPDSVSGYDGLSSPQFNRSRKKIYTALRQTLYCFDERGTACSSAWRDGCEIPGISGDLRASPLVDSSGNLYIGTKDNSDSVFYKINGKCPKSPAARVLWKVKTNGDVYTTGVLLHRNRVVIGQEPDRRSGVLKILDAADGSMEGYIDLTADMTWGSLRAHGGRLVGVANVATEFLGGFLFSIKLAAAKYAAGAENPTMRGNNAATGRF